MFERHTYCRCVLTLTNVVAADAGDWEDGCVQIRCRNQYHGCKAVQPLPQEGKLRTGLVFVLNFFLPFPYRCCYLCQWCGIVWLVQ